MRLLRFLISYVVVTILGLLMLLFLGLNRQVVQLNLIDRQHTVSLAWVMVGAAVFGFVIALLMLLPGRAVSALIVRRLQRDLQELEQQFERLDEVRERLLVQHESLLERHERTLLRYQRLEANQRQIAAAQASAAHVAEQAPAIPQVAQAASERMRDVRPAPPALQQPVQRPTAPFTSQGVERPATAPVAAAPAREQPTVSPAPFASSAPPTAVVLPTDAQPPNQSSALQAPMKSKKPLVNTSALREPVESVLAGIRHEWQRAEVLDKRLRNGITVLRVRVGAQIRVPLAQIRVPLAQIKRRNTSRDITTRNERSQESELRAGADEAVQ